MDSGHLKFHLHGQKLNGQWVLVQMHHKEKDVKDWLLIKERDGDARPTVDKTSLTEIADNQPDDLFLSLPSGAKLAAVPDKLAPQLATLVNDPPNSDHWTYEIKFDGYRILTSCSPATVSFR